MYLTKNNELLLKCPGASIYQYIQGNDNCWLYSYKFIYLINSVAVISYADIYLFHILYYIYTNIYIYIYIYYTVYSYILYIYIMYIYIYYTYMYKCQLSICYFKTYTKKIQFIQDHSFSSSLPELYQCQR